MWLDIVTGVLVSILSEIVESTLKPIVRHIGYSFCFKKIVEDLTKEKDRLKQRKQAIHEAIDPGIRNNTEVANTDVEGWLTNVDQIIEEVQTLENQIQVNKMCCKGWCPDWIWRYKLGKEATKKTTNAAKLLQEAAGWDLKQLTHRAPLPDIVTFSSNDDYEVFESRKFIFEELMEALLDDNCKRIGLHGLGGVGKTTLVMDVCKKAKDLFSDIVMTTVSQTPDITKIQVAIAECLNLNLADEKNDRGRAMRIWLRIKQAEKKILIILDDVWKDVKLEDIGIPSGEDQEKCKILLTTRSEHVCNLMHCSKKILFKFLSNDESLALIKKTASIVDDSPALNDMVRQVVEECKGLPIAIVTVGKALIRKSLTDWEVALQELKKSRLVEICGVDEDNNAYVCLKWSYDHLNRKTKLCFLMCSLFPEDYDISIEELSRYAMGLEEYNQDVNSLDEVRKQVHVAINHIRESSLLLESYRGKEYVKMHDMVRDVALWIASKGENEFKLRACTRIENINLESVTAISLMAFNTKQLPDKLVCPRLNILLLGRNEVFREISDTLFEGMNCLKVLRLEDKILSSQSLQFLTNLQSLYLKNCDFSDNLSSLGKLKRLETLSFCNCGMAALPNELGEMESLRILDLTSCYNLRRIPPNVIQRLSRLEELIIGSRCFKNWDVEGTSAEIRNTILSELNSLSRLVMLSLCLDLKHLPQGFVFPDLDLQSYYISINTISFFSYYSKPRALAIEHLNASSINVFKVLFFTVEYISIKSCEMECLVDTTGGNHTIMFTNLVELYLENMSCLRTICEGPNQYVIFSNLTVLVINGCMRLISLFSPSLAQSLKKLKKLRLEHCNEMKQIISEEEMILESHNQPICLPELQTIWVCDCGKLEYIFPLSVARGLPQLQCLELKDLPQLKQVFVHKREGGVGNENNNVLLERQYQLICLPELKTIQVCDCGRMEYIFPLSVAPRDLPQLESLELKDLPQLKQVFGHEEGDVRDGNNVLCKLRRLTLKNLTEIGRMCGGNTSSVWPSLEDLNIVNCPKMKTSFFADVEANVRALGKFQKLQMLHVDDCNAISVVLMQGLLNLEKLEIINCGGLQEVFRFEGLLTREGEQQDVFLSSLKRMRLHNLLEVRCIWKGPTQLIILNNLKDLEVFSCKKLIHLFTPTLARSMQNLKSLKIEKCDKLEHLIVEDEEDQILSSESHLQHPCFPKMEIVQVKECSKLKSVSYVDGCNAVSVFLTQGWLNSEKLEITNCEGLQEVFKLEGLLTREGEQQDVFLSSLKRMRLHNLLEVRCIWKGPTQLIILNNLKDLEVFSCKKLIHLFTPTLARSMQNLKSLKIEKCDKLEHLIVEDEEDQILSSESHLQHPCFPKMEIVQVKECSKLKSVSYVDGCNAVSVFLTQGWFNSEKLEITNCEGLQEVFKLEGLLTRDGEQDVLLLKLNEMWLHSLLELRYICKGLTQLISLNNLEDLQVFSCKKLIHLFTHTLARSLQNLKFLTIDRCDKLEHLIVEDEENQTLSLESHLQPLCFPKLRHVKVNQCNKLKVLFPMILIDNLLELQNLQVNGASQLLEVFAHEDEGDTVVQKDVTLPELEYIILKGLPSLVNFCPRNYHVMLPAFRNIKMQRCPNMTTSFTRNPDKSVHINGEVIDAMEPLVVLDSKF